MASRHLTLRIGEGLYQRLEAQGRRERTTVSELARRLIEEGLRMEAHPGIVFRPGTTGRRPAVADGPQVWVVARVFREMKGPFERAVEKTARLMELSPEKVQTAAQYYAEFSEETDRWLQDLDDEAEQAYAAWEREQELLRV